MHLAINTDNTAAETKKKHIQCMVYSAMIVYRHTVDTLDLVQGQIGHTHNEEDQRFSVARAALRRRGKLETPQEFLEQIQSGVRPVRGRDQHARIITGSYDWGELFSHMGNMKGLATGHTETQWTKERGQESVHFWRFQRRSSIQPAIPILEWPEFNKDPDDIILMVKLYASSRNTCDMHKVFLPACELAKLPDQPTLMTQRNEFVQRQIDEFNTTSKFIRKEPWNMHAAGDYIEQLIHNNSQGTSSTWTLPQLGCVLQGRHLEEIEEVPDYTVDDSALTQTTAQPVVAHPEALRRRITKNSKGESERVSSDRRSQASGQHARSGSGHEEAQRQSAGQECAGPTSSAAA